MGRTGRCKWCHRGLQDLLHDQFNLCAIPEASILPCHLQPLKSKWVLLTEVLIFIQYSFIYSCFNIFATKQRTDNQTCIESVISMNIMLRIFPSIAQFTWMFLSDIHWLCIQSFQVLRTNYKRILRSTWSLIKMVGKISVLFYGKPLFSTIFFSAARYSY